MSPYPSALMRGELVLVVRLERGQREDLELLLGGDEHARRARLGQRRRAALHLTGGRRNFELFVVKF